MKLKYAPMWIVKNTFNDIECYHYSDKQRAGNNAKLKYVIMDYDYFIGTMQLQNKFAIKILDTEEQAINYINNINKKLLI